MASAKLGRADALRLAEAASRVVCARGRNVVVYDMKSDPPDRKTLLSGMLGPTGNLRAPTVRAGSTVIVGFNEDAYREAFG